MVQRASAAILARPAGKGKFRLIGQYVPAGVEPVRFAPAVGPPLPLKIERSSLPGAGETTEGKIDEVSGEPVGHFATRRLSSKVYSFPQTSRVTGAVRVSLTISTASGVTVTASFWPFQRMV